MKAILLRWRLPLLVLAVALNMGCGLESLYFLLPHQDEKDPPKLFKIADKDKEVNVVLLAYAPLESKPEFIRADRDICSALARNMQEAFKENKEKVTIVAPRKVEKFKDEHPDWHALDLDAIGKQFKADYVIYMEIESLSLFEKGSHDQLYHAHASIDVSLIDLSKPDDYPLKKHFDTEYPTGAQGAVSVDDRNAQEFKESFIEYMAKHLTWYFTSCTTEKGFHDDDR